MSIVQTIMQGIVQLIPDKKPDKLISKTKYVGQPISRVDGQLKVMGEAKFSAEYKIENICYAALAYSSIAKGKIKKINLEEAQKSDGVITIITHENSPKMKDPLVLKSSGGRGSAATDLIPIQDRNIYWNGQPIAVVIAETNEQAEAAAMLITAEYEAGEAKVSFEKGKKNAKTPSSIMMESNEVNIGDAEEELKKAAYAVDNVYETPNYNHNAIEPHATIAVFKEDGKLLMYDATQNLWGVKNTIAKMMSLKPDDVQVVSPFVGGGFGCKGAVWFSTMLCVMAAEAVGKPVKMNLSREGVFRIVGGRTRSEQRAAIGADANGKFVSIIHTGFTATTEGNPYPERFSFPVRHLYDAKSFFIRQQMMFLDMVQNTFMRAPGESIGTFALETAIDELAVKMGMDPIELRLKNEPEKDPLKGTAFSLRHLVEAYRNGAKKWGWKHTEPRSRKEGEWQIGQGVATATYPFYRLPATAKICLYADGTAVVKSAAHEMGMGTVTVQLQHAADRLGLPIENISFEYGDSNLPKAAQAGASIQTVSVAAAIAAAADELTKELLKLAQKDKQSPLHGLKEDEVELKDGGLFSRKEAAKGVAYKELLKNAEKGFIEVEGAGSIPIEIEKYSMHSYGAQFCEVKVNEITGEVRVSRWLGSFDTGTILNSKTATSQFRGGIVMGIGMALTEETFFDERNGRIMNPSLAEYHVPVNADVPYIDVIYNDIPDEHTPLGAHGIGEIGITGTAAAIANAIFNATGKRVRDLPITMDKIYD